MSWSYDTSIISADCTSDDIVFTALAEGTTLVKATAGGQSAAMSVRVLPASTIKVNDPYVYAMPDILQLTTGSTDKICAAVYGGLKNSNIKSLRYRVLSKVVQVRAAKLAVAAQEGGAGYTFSIDKGAVASMQIEGNYCYLTGKSAGIAKITVRHSASSWPYSCIVVCDADLTKVPYLTTKQSSISS